MRRLAFTLVAAGCLVARAASAGGFTDAEKQQLERGESIKRELTLELPQGRFVGGVAYAIVAAPQHVIMHVLMQPPSYAEILPATLEVREIERRGVDRFVYMKHGTSLGTAGYVCHIRPESGQLVRFWMDPTREHEITDLWGFFRVEALGPQRSLVTFGVLVDLGLGAVTRMLFEDRIRARAMKAPEKLRTFVEERVLGRGLPGR